MRVSYAPISPSTAISTVEITVEGEIGGYDTRIIGLSVLKGLFGGVSDEPVTYVNAPQRAKEAGVDVREVSSTSSADWVNLISISGGGHSLSGTLAGRRSEHRIVLIDGHTFDVPPAEHMLMVTNDDRPGVIGTVGTLLGDAGVNIADMDVGRANPLEDGTSPGTAVMLIAPTSPVPQVTLDALRAAPGILSVAALTA